MVLGEKHGTNYLPYTIKKQILYILLSFCYHKRLSGYSPSNRFLYYSLLFSSLFYIPTQQKNPGNLTVPGHLTLGHNVPDGTQYILN